MGNNFSYYIASNGLKLVGIGLVFMILSATALTMLEPKIKPRDLNYSPLLEAIAEGESRGNYNAYYGNVNNNSTDFTQMKVAEVLQWQKNFVESGSPSSAVGKYQFIRPTLNRLVEELNINKDARFDEKLQDKLAVALLERRGLSDYIDGNLDRDQFAHNLSKEWAALPKVLGDNPDESYYEGDGLNKVQIHAGEIYSSIDLLAK
jgi:conjugal transfer mating pair stabilization protein TraG